MTRLLSVLSLGLWARAWDDLSTHEDFDALREGIATGALNLEASPHDDGSIALHLIGEDIDLNLGRVFPDEVQSFERELLNTVIRNAEGTQTPTC
jgi:hypothetical protein